MFKKLTARTDNQGESSQVELANPALQDIIASNDVIVTKKPRKRRISRACKAVLIVFVLGLLVIGIVVVALVLANSRNNIMTLISRSTPEPPTANNSRVLLDDIRESVVTSTEHHHQQQQGEENWKEMIATSVSSNNNTPQFTSRQVHLSSTTMMTKEYDQQTTTNTPLLKYHSSSSTFNAEQSTVNNPIQTTLANRQRIFSTNNYHPTTAEIKLTTAENHESTQLSSETQILTTTSTPSIQHSVTKINEQQTFTTTDVFTTDRLIHSRFKLNTPIGINKNVLATLHNDDFDEDEDAIDSFYYHNNDMLLRVQCTNF